MAHATPDTEDIERIPVLRHIAQKKIRQTVTSPDAANQIWRLARHLCHAKRCYFPANNSSVQ